MFIGICFTIFTYHWYTIIFNKHQTNFWIHKFDPKKVIGKNIRENYIHPNNIILTKQMWQSKYIICATILQNLQNGKISYLDFDLLTTCFLTTLNVNLFSDPWMTTTFIIPKNELWNTINNQMMHINSI
jgi:hypothetical protein